MLITLIVIACEGDPKPTPPSTRTAKPVLPLCEAPEGYTFGIKSQV